MHSKILICKFLNGKVYNIKRSALTTEAAKSLLHLNSSDSLTITPSAYMAARGWKSGIDILNVYFQYDYHVDTLFVGVDCDGKN